MTDTGTIQSEHTQKALLEQMLAEVISNALSQGLHQTVVADQLLCEAALILIEEGDEGQFWANHKVERLRRSLLREEKLLDELLGRTETTPIKDEVVAQMKKDREQRR